MGCQGDTSFRDPAQKKFENRKSPYLSIVSSEVFEGLTNKQTPKNLVFNFLKVLFEVFVGAVSIRPP